MIVRALSKKTSFPTFVISLTIALPLLAGCNGHETQSTATHTTPTDAAEAASETSGDKLALGVVHHAIPVGTASGIDLIDVNLDTTKARLSIATEHVQMLNGHVAGNAYTPSEWLDKTKGLAAINGGYFGYEDPSGAKEFVGLLVQESRVRHAAPPIQGHGGALMPAALYSRSAFGILRSGMPSIVWAATEPGKPKNLMVYDTPTSKGTRDGTPWPVRDAVGCGPALIRDAKIVVTDREERLVNPGARPRTFVAYDRVGGKPKHFVMGMASSLSYQDLAEFLSGYFTQYHGTHGWAAMCLDGGASTQLSYRTGDTVQSPLETGVTVPDSVVLLPE